MSIRSRLHPPAIDATPVLQRYTARILTLPRASLADVEVNGEIDSRDAALTLQLIAGLISALPP